MRGKKAKAMLGQMAGGGFHRLYGYDYIKVADNNGGRRVINENEAKWVRQIYQWLVNDGLSTTAITYRLRGLNAPTKEGGLWCRAAVLNILKNPAYTGKTYAFTTIKAGEHRGYEAMAGCQLQAASQTHLCSQLYESVPEHPFLSLPEAVSSPPAHFHRHFPYQVAMRHPDPHYSYQQ